MDLSNYGIKKMIPRLIIAAILVNLSYYICVLAVELSNVLGYNLMALLGALDIGTVASGNGAFANIWTQAISGLLVGAGVAMLIVGLFAAPAALISLGIVILILIARKALIILLIVLAPIAFVAYLLPNTEEWFKKWYKLFFAMLIVFPLVAVVFGASKLAASILMQVATADNSDTNNTLFLAAAATLSVPAIVIPGMLMKILNSLGNIGSKVSSMNGRVGKQAKGQLDNSIAGRYKKHFTGERDKRRAMVQSGTYRGTNKNPLNWSRNIKSGALGAANASRFTGQFGDRQTAMGTEIADKMWDEEVGRQSKLITVQKNLTNDEIIEQLESGEGSDEYQAALGSVIMKRNHRASHLRAIEAVRNRRASAPKGSAQEKTARSIQKQMKADGGSNMPWAAGENSQGDMVNGNYTGNGGSLRDEMRDRVETHLSVEKLAGMNPDELKSIHKMAKNHELKPEQLKSFQGAIKALRMDETYKGVEKPNATKLYEEVLSNSYTKSANGSSAHYNDKDVF